jgi:F-type H+-transporting ATPase subunit b
MVNLSILISSSEINGPGGLFDFNATLPLVAIQFVLLMLILNTILYSPLLTVIEERKEYILGNLAKASEILAQANELTTQYEQELSNVRKEAQLEITNSQKIHKEILEIELNISQKYIDNLLDTIAKDLLNKKNTALNSLDTIVQSLCSEIETRLSI